MTKQQYRAYLRSKAWADFKARYIAAKQPMGCFICGSDFHHMHHLTYARVGNELLDDVVPVCRTCHGVVHYAHDARHSYQQTISSISYAVKAMYQRCIAEGTTERFTEIVREYYDGRRRWPLVTIGPITRLVNSPP